MINQLKTYRGSLRERERERERERIRGRGEMLVCTSMNSGGCCLATIDYWNVDVLRLMRMRVI